MFFKKVLTCGNEIRLDRSYRYAILFNIKMKTLTIEW